jgi:hypothetical protein
MSRYALFSTGIEYKFTAQESIESFGGDGVCGYDMGAHYWTEDDGPRILAILKRIEIEYSITRPRFEKYSPDYNGTAALRWDLLLLDADDSIKYKYILGCIIYHQLLYNSPLSAEYDI